MCLFVRKRKEKLVLSSTPRVDRGDHAFGFILHFWNISFSIERERSKWWEKRSIFLWYTLLPFCLSLYPLTTFAVLSYSKPPFSFFVLAHKILWIQDSRFSWLNPTLEQSSISTPSTRWSMKLKFIRWKVENNWKEATNMFVFLLSTR